MKIFEIENKAKKDAGRFIKGLSTEDHRIPLKVEEEDGVGIKNLFDFYGKSLILRSEDTFGLDQYRFD